jgi:hypothetical protein
VQRIREKLMSRLADSEQIDLRFGDQPRGMLNFRVGVPSGDFARERFHLVRQHWIGANG